MLCTPSSQGRIDKHKFPLADEFPVKTDGLPVKADGFPVKADGLPVKADGLPVKTDGFPVKTDGFPVKTDGLPAKADGFPVKADGFPLKETMMLSQNQRRVPVVCLGTNDGNKNVARASFHALFCDCVGVTVLSDVNS